MNAESTETLNKVMKTRNCSSIVNGYAIINSTEGIKNIGKDRSKTLFRDIIT